MNVLNALVMVAPALGLVLLLSSSPRGLAGAHWSATSLSCSGPRCGPECTSRSRSTSSSARAPWEQRSASPPDLRGDLPLDWP